MMDREESYQPGEKVVYRRKGDVFNVEIVENLCDSKTIEYRLKILEVKKLEIKDGKRRVGTEFQCDKGLDEGPRGLWHLMDA